jgi:hypothetical protein
MTRYQHVFVVFGSVAEDGTLKFESDAETTISYFDGNVFDEEADAWTRMPRELAENDEALHLELMNRIRTAHCEHDNREPLDWVLRSERDRTLGSDLVVWCHDCDSEICDSDDEVAS